MKITTSFLLLLFGFIAAQAQSKIGEGRQPQLTLDEAGAIRLVYGKADEIYYSVSADNGKSFSAPVLVGSVKEMHLGMTRGPQLASSRDFSVVTAMDKKGNIHAFRLRHRTKEWEKMQNVNDVEGSAPEGLMSISADGANNFYAVWLDVREDRKNNIWFSSLSGKGTWSRNELGYKSPDGHVCECCKPSIAVNGDNISIMFRNWLRGSRDLYLITSDDKGQQFSRAEKLGLGTWPLKGCPMDGGGLSIDSRKHIHTAWQRDGIVFYAEPGKPEEKVGEGRGVGVSGRIIHWQKGSSLVFKPFNGDEQKLGEGRGLKMLELQDESIFAIWEKDDQIVYRKM